MPRLHTSRGLTHSLLLFWLTALLALPPLRAPAEPLHGHLEHVQRLPAVSNTLRPGVRFDQTDSQNQSNIWVRVPSWLAGIWQVNEETAVYRENYQTGQKSSESFPFSARSEFSYGKQQDKRGQIWHYIGVPYTSATQLSNKIEYHHVIAKDITQQGEDVAMVSTKAQVIRVSKTTNEIVETYQQESLTKYTKLANGTIQLESSNKVFDADGNPVSITNNRATIHRSRPFSIVNFESGKNLKELFAQFLISQGMTILVPD